jgi:hypothetical protein
MIQLVYSSSGNSEPALVPRPPMHMYLTPAPGRPPNLLAFFFLLECTHPCEMCGQKSYCTEYQ